MIQSSAKTALFVGLIALLSACSPGKENATQFPDVKPPVAEKKPFEIVAKHGHKRIDNYYWLKEREDSTVIRYLNAENKYLDTMMAHTKAFREKLYNEMKGRIKEKDESVPYKDGDYFYYTRFEEGYDYPIYCRKKGSLEATEEIIADGNELGKNQKYFNMSISQSPNHNIIAFSIDTIGRRFYTIKFKDMTTGKMLPDQIPSTSGNLEWSNDNLSIVYSKQDPNTLRDDKIIIHTLGAGGNDKLIYEEKDETLSTYVTKTKSKKYILVNSGRTDAAFSQFLDADHINSKLTVIEPLQNDVEYAVDHAGDKFYIRTNLGAKNYRLVETTAAKPSKENWKDVIPGRDNVFFRGFELTKNYLAVEEESEGLTKIRLIKWSDKSESSIDFGEPAYVAGIDINRVFDSQVIRYNYQSMTTPPSTYDYNIETKEKALLKQREVVGGFNAANYQTERVMATARDGAKVPVSIVYRKDKFKKDGTNPCLEYAYGSYGSSTYATFSSNRLSLLDRGFVYAIAHIRGGQEMGGQWYEDGKMMKKKNTFTDFIDVSEYLVTNKYSAKDKLFAYGGSAGGLLMGAITNMRPDLYKGVIAAVPFVDVITTMMDESIPLTTFEWREWGNPNIQEQYEYMLSYSPYDQVEKKDYPNILVTTSLHDSQVQYWEPAKWVAKLRDMKTDKNLLLMSINMNAGHGGSSGRFRAINDEALRQAFLLDLAGIKE
ncbi:MAG TPA: S9 family peptidase [Cyclobacteriaceae bacterium]|nr:S9 family peptidase [Cyclobacteriaceae bacterium]